MPCALVQFSGVYVSSPRGSCMDPALGQFGIGTNIAGHRAPATSETPSHKWWSKVGHPFQPTAVGHHPGSRSPDKVPRDESARELCQASSKETNESRGQANNCRLRDPRSGIVLRPWVSQSTVV